MKEDSERYNKPLTIDDLCSNYHHLHRHHTIITFNVWYWTIHHVHSICDVNGSSMFHVLDNSRVGDYLAIYFEPQMLINVKAIDWY